MIPTVTIFIAILLPTIIIAFQPSSKFVSYHNYLQHRCDYSKMVISAVQQEQKEPSNNESLQKQQQQQQLHEQCLDVLKRHNIKLVVFDMDLTAVSMHSRGRMERGEKLEEYVMKATPGFRSLIPLLYNNGFSLAIATHSDEEEFKIRPTIKQETHILGRELALEVLKKHFPSNIVSSFYIIAFNPNARARIIREQKQQQYGDEGIPSSSSYDDITFKRYHFREIQNHFHNIKSNQILFFDDTEDIIQDCRETCGITYSFQVNPEVGFCIQNDLLDNLS